MTTTPSETMTGRHVPRSRGERTAPGLVAPFDATTPCNGVVAGGDSTPTPPPGIGEAKRSRVSKALFVSVIAAPVLEVLALIAAALLVGGSFELSAYYTVAVVFVTWCGGSYRSRINPRISEDVPRILGRLGLPLLVAPILFHSTAQLGKLTLLAALSAVLVISARLLANIIVRGLRHKRLIMEQTLIVGAGTQGVLLASTLREHPEYGLVPVGFLDSFTDTLNPPILGNVGVLDELLASMDIHRVIVAFGGTREPEMVQVLRACDDARVELYVVPRFFELGVAPTGPTTEHLWGIPLVHLRRSVLRAPARRAKRVFDFTGALCALVLLSPLLIAGALAVRFTSKGPILFRQTRVGQRGEEFELFKFRTLRVNDDSDTQWSVNTDDRVTSAGRILRRTSMDELPQLINVLRGDMSLVGPRPERPHFVSQFREKIPRYGDRHRVPVGMTGWAQVHGLRGDTSIEERSRFDNHYIEHWSLWRDFVILGRTVRAAWQHNGAPPEATEQAANATPPPVVESRPIGASGA